mmetsp:Transcript_117340/g.184571  ORF Transcript_117340/g.184571 Transcript_117340/m.184571 type:complete len:235 (+) Transcript_117340:262-966(+)
MVSRGGNGYHGGAPCGIQQHLGLTRHGLDFCMPPCDSVCGLDYFGSSADIVAKSLAMVWWRRVVSQRSSFCDAGGGILFLGFFHLQLLLVGSFLLHLDGIQAKLVPSGPHYWTCRRSYASTLFPILSHEYVVVPERTQRQRGCSWEDAAVRLTCVIECSCILALEGIYHVGPCKRKNGNFHPSGDRYNLAHPQVRGHFDHNLFFDFCSSCCLSRDSVRLVRLRWDALAQLDMCD